MSTSTNATTAMDTYYLSLLVVGGVCLGFALHLVSLAIQTRRRRDRHLLTLALLETGYCFFAWRYLSLKDGAEALPWGQTFCAFTPCITLVFGELTMDLTEVRPRWLLALQKANFVVTISFAMGVVADILWSRSVVVKPTILTDLDSLHRHRFVFTPVGIAYLAWVSVAFCSFAASLLRRHRTRRDLRPMIVGCIVYFTSTVADFGICIGVCDGPYVQHFGVLALILGCWRLLSNRFEETLAEMRRAVVRLEAQRNRLLIAAPMLHKQKLDSLGTLAAGVAHEINNPIHGIMNYALLLKRQVEKETMASKFADEIASESKRVADIVQSLLRFGRADSTVAVAADIGEILEGTLSLIRTGLGHRGIALEVGVEEDMPEITCRAAQLQQVIMNLVMNARDAILTRDPERIDDPKSIRIDVAHEIVSGEPWVVLEIRDTGDGFDPELATRIFDPFFTTKGADGTGLGLSVSHGIVDAHGGSITGESVPGHGAVFRVRVPCRGVPPTTAPSAGRLVVATTP